MSEQMPIALGFYLDHAEDIDTLMENETCPDGVDESDWEMLTEVCELADLQGAKLLLRIGSEVYTELSDTIVTTKPPTASKVREDFDCSYKFKLEGSGKRKEIGCFGLGLTYVEGGGSVLAPYLEYVDKEDGRDVANELAKEELIEEAPDWWWEYATSRSFPLAVIEVSSSTNVDQLITRCVSAFTTLKPRLKSIFS